jgi:glucose-6-phosphate 1-epimerase
VHCALRAVPQAVFEEGKPIRGGVPVCWPWFGPSLEDAQLPMHGFVRNRFWKLDSVEQDKTGVSLRFKLKDSAKTRKLWPHAFELTLEMFIGATLRLALTMKNTGDDTLFITDALHTYLCVGDVTQVSVSGLERMEYLDRVGAPVVRQQRGKVTFSQEVDRDYAARGSVVLSDVPAHVTVAGVPAKVVGYAGCTEPARAMDHNVEPVAAPEDKG